MDFENFLTHMSAQTGTSMQLPNTEDIMQKHLQETAPVQEYQAPPPAAPQPVPQSVSQSNELREDSIERVYEATAAVMKSIRKAFPNKAEQQLAYQSIYEAVGAAMGFSKVNDRSNRPTNPGRTYPTTQPVFRELPDGSLEEVQTPAAAPVKSDYIVPRQNNLEGQFIDMSEYHRQVNESMRTDDGYSRAIDIKPGQGLAGVSEKDINDLKALAGITK